MGTVRNSAPSDPGEVARASEAVTETQTSKATPWPWTASNAPDGSGIPGWNIFGADGRCVCSMMDADAATTRINPANASLIVRAVNSHADLLAACKDALNNLDRSLRGERGGFRPLEVSKTLRAAIAKAEGK